MLEIGCLLRENATKIKKVLILLVLRIATVLQGVTGVTDMSILFK